MSLGTPAINPEGTASAPSSVNIAQVGGSPVTLGQALSANSIPVVLPSDQTVNVAIVSGNITNYAKETGGNLAILAGGVSSSVYQTNIAKIGGNNVVTAGAAGVIAVGGKDSEGVAPGTNPVLIGIIDASGQIAYTESASAAAGSAANRLLGTGILGWDYTSAYWRAKVDSSGKQYVATVDTITNPVTVNTISGFATSANQTNASQKTQIVDGSGNVIAATSNALNVSVTNATLAVTQSGTWNIGTLTSITNTVTVSGTVTANAGSGTFNIQSNASINLAQVNGSTVATVGTGIQTVGLSDGTNTANVLAGDSGQNSQIITGGRKEVSFTTTTAQAVASTDVSNYSFVSVHITSQGTNSTVNFQGSNDNSNWVGLNLIRTDQGQSNATQTSSASNNLLFRGSLGVRYFRLNVTGITAGTTAGVVEFFSNPNAIPVGAIQPGNFANTTAWLVAGGKTNNNAAPGAINLGALVGIANATQQTWSEGNEVLLSTNLKGSVRTIIQDAALNDRGVNVDTSNNMMVNVGGGLIPTGTSLSTYSVHITTNTTNTPTSSTAYISSIAISNEVTGTGSTITIQDKQGTPLKLVNGFSTTSLTTTPTTVTFSTPVKMVSGIDVITAGVAAATVDVWINYYQ